MKDVSPVLETRRPMVARERRHISTGDHGRVLRQQLFTGRRFLLCASDGACRAGRQASRSRCPPRAPRRPPLSARRTGAGGTSTEGPPPIAADPRRGKHELPLPLRRRRRIFSIERERQDCSPHANGKIPLVLLLHVGQVSQQPLLHECRQHRSPILLALAAPDHDLIEIEVHVLHAKLEAILQAKPGAVQQRDDDPGYARQRFQDPSDLVPAQDHRQARRRALASQDD